MNVCSQLEIKNFSVTRGDFSLHPVSFSVRAGEIFAILGRTGSGKTVLLEAASGMFPGNQGVILLNGTDICQIPPRERRIGFVYQDHGLFPHMDVFHNIAYGLKMHGVPADERTRRVHEIMDAFSIRHISRQYPGTLSGGERQRTALARALILRPILLLLDEPFSALDPATRSKIHRQLLAVHEQYKCTILFVTHDFQEAASLSDRIAILLDGHLETVVESGQLLAKHYNKNVEEFLGRSFNHE